MTFKLKPIKKRPRISKFLRRKYRKLKSETFWIIFFLLFLFFGISGGKGPKRISDSFAMSSFYNPKNILHFFEKKAFVLMKNSILSYQFKVNLKSSESVTLGMLNEKQIFDILKKTFKILRLIIIFLLQVLPLFKLVRKRKDWIRIFMSSPVSTPKIPLLFLEVYALIFCRQYYAISKTAYKSFKTTLKLFKSYQLIKMLAKIQKKKKGLENVKKLKSFFQKLLKFLRMFSKICIKLMRIQIKDI